MVYDIAQVRGLYGSLGDGWTYLNAHACPQIPERVASAVARSFRLSPGIAPAGAPGGLPAGHTTGDTLIDDARLAIAELVGATPGRVVLGPSLEVLYHSLTHAIRPLLRHNSSVVLSNLDPPIPEIGRAHV